MKTVLIAALIAAPIALGVAGPAGAANLIANGGFETAGFDGWSFTTIGLADAQQPSDAHTGSGAALFGADPMIQGGVPQVADSLAQQLSTVAGQAYTLSYWLGVSNLQGLPIISEFWTRIDGVLTTDVVNPVDSDYVRFTYEFVADDAFTSVSFNGYSKWGTYKLDDVSLTAKVTAPDGPPIIVINPVGGVPEPSAWAMMIVGFGVVGAVLRSRRRPALSLP